MIVRPPPRIGDTAEQGQFIRFDRLGLLVLCGRRFTALIQSRRLRRCCFGCGQSLCFNRCHCRNRRLDCWPGRGRLGAWLPGCWIPARPGTENKQVIVTGMAITRFFEQSVFLHGHTPPAATRRVSSTTARPVKQTKCQRIQGHIATQMSNASSLRVNGCTKSTHLSRLL